MRRLACCSILTNCLQNCQQFSSNLRKKRSIFQDLLGSVVAVFVSHGCFASAFACVCAFFWQRLENGASIFYSPLPWCPQSGRIEQREQSVILFCREARDLLYFFSEACALKVYIDVLHVYQVVSCSFGVLFLFNANVLMQIQREQEGERLKPGARLHTRHPLAARAKAHARNNDSFSSF